MSTARNRYALYAGIILIAVVSALGATPSRRQQADPPVIVKQTVVTAEREAAPLKCDAARITATILRRPWDATATTCGVR